VYNPGSRLRAVRLHDAIQAKREFSAAVPRGNDMKRIPIALCCLLVVVSACRREEQAAAPRSKPAPPAAAKTPAPAPGRDVAAVPGIGSAMPEYSTKGLDGSTFSTKGEKGNVVLLNMWATWCGPCRAEIPVLQGLHGKYSAQGFKVVGVSLDDSSAQADVRKFVLDHKMTYPVVLDPDSTLANMFQATVIPTSVLVDRQGKIVWQQIGALPENDTKLVAAIERALAAKG
jgi:cytochrome c biogenesis protein CcmG, thiol:disulfide interchange protein DsbE